MTIFHAVILGIVQGIAEFFPISSSGHLVILQALFGLKEPQLAFDIFLHFGTLVSIAIFFYKDIVNLFNRADCFRQSAQFFRSTLFYIIIASIPALIVGFVFKDAIEGFFGMPKIVGAMLAATGAWLIFASARSKKIKQPSGQNFFNSLAIGIAQGVAVLPGISRSGATIGAGMLAGIDRVAVFRFSFLLSIPAVAGACILKAHNITTVAAKGEMIVFLAGGIAAAITGLITLRLLLGIVRSNRLGFFGIYCILAGILVIMLI